MLEEVRKLPFFLIIFLLPCKQISFGFQNASTLCHLEFFFTLFLSHFALLLLFILLFSSPVLTRRANLQIVPRVYFSFDEGLFVYIVLHTSSFVE